MTLNTPQLNRVTVFDAHYPYTFTFLYSGEQALKNRLVIHDNVTNEIVYDNTQDGLRLNHVLQADTLQNAKTYLAQIQVFDADGNSSNLSEILIFNCYTTPEFHFANVNDGDVISSANHTCKVSFLQNENDTVKEYKYYLYDSNKSQLSVSDSYYTLNTSGYTYYGFVNMTSYYLRCVGKTAYGFDIDTGYIRIDVKYDCIPTNVAVSAVNQDGKIVINVNIITTDYDLKNNNYILENGELSLIDNEITYHVKDISDFSLIIKARNIPVGKKFAKVIGEGGTAVLSVEQITDRYYCKLNVTNGYETCVLYKEIQGRILGDTNNTPISDTKNNSIQTITNTYDSSTLIVFEVHREGNLYSLDAYYN